MIRGIIFPRNAPDTLAPDAIALFAQVPCHLAAAVERRLHELRINQLHQRQVQRRFCAARPVPGRPAHADQRALPDDRQRGV